MKEAKKDILENHSEISFQKYEKIFFIVFTEKWNIKDKYVSNSRQKQDTRSDQKKDLGK